MSERTVVVIDDEPDVTTYLSTLLSDNGWEVRSANSSREGLRLIEGRRPSAVLVDLMMPEEGGLHVLVAIRKNPAMKDLPVIIVSGIQDKLNADYHAFLGRFKHYHPDAFLDKPVVPELLLAELDRLTRPA